MTHYEAADCAICDSGVVHRSMVVRVAFLQTGPNGVLESLKRRLGRIIGHSYRARSALLEGCSESLWNSGAWFLPGGLALNLHTSGNFSIR